MTNFVIRNAVIADYPAICALYGEFDTYHLDGVPHIFAPVADPARTRKVVQAALDDPNQALLIAQFAERIIGLLRISFRDREPPFVLKRIAVVEEVIVTSNERGAGVGREFLMKAQELASDHGAVEVWLDVFEFNTLAIGLYESLGYEQVVRRLRLTLNS
ncbi:MAG: GNAT family N-acetyltransferase [Thermomicrobiales bacterium]